jgi:hypothetical protein
MRRYIFIACMFAMTYASFPQDQVQDPLKNSLARSLTNIYQETLLRPGIVNIDSIFINDKKKSIEIYTNLSLSFLPMRELTIKQVYDSVRYHIPFNQKKYRISVYSDEMEISELIPNFHRSKQLDKKRIISQKATKPLVTNISNPAGTFLKGLQNNHIALWQSHGWYYEQKLGRWEWQRARIFQTVEDLYTQSYVIPFLTPMLENAGANVILPRERDYNKVELIIDRDGYSSGEYREINGRESWYDNDSFGFANIKEFYTDGENPFMLGKARQNFDEKVIQEALLVRLVYELQHKIGSINDVGSIQVQILYGYQIQFHP